ncbi:hypothetical protein [Microbacterium sp. NPDC055683]
MNISLSRRRGFYGLGAGFMLVSCTLISSTVSAQALSSGARDFEVKTSMVEAPEGMEIAPLTDEERSWAEKQDALSEAVNLISATYATEYSFAYFANPELDKLVIGFSDDAPLGAINILDATGKPYEIEEKVGFNNEEYVDASASALSDAANANQAEIDAGRMQIAASPDPELGAGSIAIEYTITDPNVEIFSAGVSDAMNRAAESSPFSIVEQVAEGEIFQSVSNNRAGGTSLLLSQYGKLQCTSGFVVKARTGSDVGVLTAGHCDTGGNLWYYFASTAERYELNRRNAYFGSQGDAMFFRSSKMMDGWFHIAATTGRPVESVRNPLKGNNVCVYGRVTNASHCGKVVDQQTSVVTNAGTVGNVAIIEAPGMTNGDSGGPAYGGNIALGILSSTTSTRIAVTTIGAAMSLTGTNVCNGNGC